MGDGRLAVCLRRDNCCLHGAGIPPNATLVFEIEILAIREGKPGPAS